MRAPTPGETAPVIPAPEMSEPKYGLLSQVKHVHENAFGGYHDYPVGEGALIDRQALTEEKFAKKALGKGFGGLVKKLGDTNVERTSGSVHLFSGDNIKQLATGYQSVGKEKGYSDYDTWKESALDSMIDDKDLKFKDDQAKLIKRAEVSGRLEQLEESGVLGSDESVSSLAKAVEQYQDADDLIKSTRDQYKSNSLVKRAVATGSKLAKDAAALPTKPLVMAHAWAVTRKAAADPEKMAKTRGILNTLGVMATTAYLGYRTAKGLGADEFVEGFLPWGSDGVNKAHAAGISTAVTNVESGMPSPVSSASPLETPSTKASASASSSPSASPSLSPSASPSPSESLSPSPSASASASASPEATAPIVPGEDDIPNKRVLDELEKDTEELTPTTAVGFESDLGKFERDESGKYWKGTLEWKMREAAAAQGLELTDRQIGTATHRMMQEHGISYAEARNMPDNYHVKWTEEQLDKYFDGFDTDAKEDGEKKEVEKKEPGTGTGEEDKEAPNPEDKTDDDKELTPEEKEAKRQAEYERNKHLTDPEAVGGKPAATDLGDPRLEAERRKLLGDPAVPVSTGTTFATPVASASASPEAQTETGGGAGTAVAIGAAVAGVTAASLLTAKAIRKNRKGKPVETLTDDEKVDLSSKREAEVRAADEDDDEDDEDDEPFVRRPAPAARVIRRPDDTEPIARLT